MSDQSDKGILSHGDVLNNTYVIADLVASGGTGEVYRATNRVSGREIAIKILKREFAQNEQFTDLMKREASVLHEVIDPAVVRYYDLLESDMHGGFLFIVMEFINGQSLADEMKARGPLDAGVLLKVAERVLQGLKAAHDKNAFHRDLSPDNIILRDGDPEQATLIDFGIAKDVNEGAKTVVGGGFAGKYQYASPEQMEGRVDARSDLYSLGMTLLGAFRGQAPLQGSSMMEIIKAKAVKPDTSDMTGKLKELVDRLVEPGPENRLQSAQEALRFLGRADTRPASAGAAGGDRTVVMPRTVPPTRPRDAELTAASETRPVAKGEPRRGRGAMILALVLLLAAGGVAGAWFAGLIGPEPVVVVDGDVTDPDPPADPETPPADDGTTAPDAQTGPEGDTGTAEATDPEADTDPQAPQLPLADPYRLTIERTTRADPLRLVGNVPAPDRLSTLTKVLEDTLDSFAVLADVTPARGEPFEGWTDRIVAIAQGFAALDAFAVVAEGNEVVLIARAENDVEKSALLAAARRAVEGTELAIVDGIEVAPPPLTLDTLRTGLRLLETCGPLELVGGTDGVIGPDDTLRLTGRVAEAADRTRLATYFGHEAPGRGVASDLEVMSPGVCNFLGLLPKVRSEAVQIGYAYGTKDGTPPNDTFRLGENPVIDVLVPAARSGYLYVAFVDLDNQIFHMLPHQARPENDLRKIGTVEGDVRRVRVAFPVADASIEQLGFKVVEPLGTNVLLAIVTDTPLFDQLRPRAESNAAFADALQGRLATIPEQGGLVSWRLLRTEK